MGFLEGGYESLFYDYIHRTHAAVGGDYGLSVQYGTDRSL